MGLNPLVGRGRIEGGTCNIRVARGSETALFSEPNGIKTMSLEPPTEELLREFFIPGVGPGASASPELGRALGRFLADAREGWPTLDVDWRAFVGHVASKLADRAKAAEALARLHAADLLLAWACTEQDAAAIRELENRYLRRVPTYLQSMRLGAATVDEVRQELSRKLLVHQGDRKPRLQAYAGRGSLESWVRVAALHTAVSLLRTVKPYTPTDSVAELALGTTPDPELDFVKQHHRAEFVAAFRKAVVSLSSRDRNLLRLHYLDDVGVGAMARLYDVHRITMARWLATIKGSLLERTRETLRVELEISPSECDSLIEMAGSRLGVALSSILKTAGP